VSVPASRALAFLLVASAAAGCSALLGLDGDFDERAALGAGGAGTTGSGGSTGSGGAGTASDAGPGGGGGASTTSTDAGPGDAGDQEGGPVDAAPACGSACYDGPPDTLYAGSACHAGTLECVDGGATCVGQALPAIPVTPSEDANCDHVGDLSCVPRARFPLPPGSQLGGGGDAPAQVEAVRLTPSRDVLVAGGVADVGCSDAGAICSFDAFVARLGATDGAVLGVIAPALASSTSVATGLALSPSGATACVTGRFQGTISFETAPGGGPPLASGLSADCFAAWLGASGLTFEHQLALADGCVRAGTPAMRDDGTTVLVGSFTSAVGLTIGPGHYGLDSGGLEDGFVAMLGPAPQHDVLWAKQLKAVSADGGAGGVDVRTATFDANGHIWLGGRFTGALQLGGLSLTSMGGFDVFLAELLPDGTVAKLRGCGSAADDAFGGLVTNPAGDELVLAATRDASESFSCANLTVGPSGQSLRPVFVRMSLDVKFLGTAQPNAIGTVPVTGLAALPGGHFVAAGVVDGLLVPHPTSDAQDGWIALLDPKLGTSKTLILGGAGQQIAKTIDASPWSGDVFVTGTSGGELTVDPLPKRSIPAGGGFGVLLWP
jgi:hypothetical protein